MSEETCPKCGKPKDICRCFEITLKHTGVPSKPNDNPEGELEKTKAELKQMRDVVAISALKEFDRELNALIESAPDLTDEQIADIRERVDEPSKLEGAKVWVNILNQASEYGKPPSGKAVLRSTNPYGKKFEGMKNVIDELYEIQADPTKTQLEKSEADSRLNSLFTELIRGVHSSQVRGKFPTFVKTTCPQCGNLIDGRAKSCPECGWTLLVPRQERSHH